VARPDRVALLEAARTSAELSALGMTNQLLTLNCVFHAADTNDRLAVAVESRGAEALSGMPAELHHLRRVDVPLQVKNIVGLNALRSLFTPMESVSIVESARDLQIPDIASLADLIEELGQSDHGLVMVMGKGGVGKTTVAAAVAIGLAKLGFPVHLTTTDPAQHIHETLQAQMPGLRVSYIDPKQEVKRYRERTLETARDKLTTDKLELLAEELKSPCYEEVAVFRAFSRIVVEARKGFVVVDTAPTGHTLMLLDTAGAYHRQMTEHANNGARIRTPLMLLQDPNYTKILIVALPETTPVLEASALQDDLRRAKIEPFAWVINGSLAAANPTDPVLRARAAAEVALIAKVKDKLSHRTALIAFQIEEPAGIERLAALAHGSR
jgi:arsenite-transporting ATPase